MRGRTRRFRAVAATVSLLAGATGCALGARAKASVHHPLAVPPPKPAMRVMPLGDSITDGLLPPGGYRSDLWQYLTADGLDADFVGSRSNGPPQLGDRDEEGHPGWRIQELYAHARGWLLRYRPDVVLLHIGTNDVIQRSNLKRAPRRLGALVDLIADDPAVRPRVRRDDHPAGRPGGRAEGTRVQRRRARPRVRTRRQGPARPPRRHARRADRQGHLRRRHPPDERRLLKDGRPLVLRADRRADDALGGGETGVHDGQQRRTPHDGHRLGQRQGRLPVGPGKLSGVRRPGPARRHVACTYARATA